MKKKLTVTIGIPAYNEQDNIGYLLESLVHQQKKSYILKKIFVYSDGSTDNTNKIVSSYKSTHVKLLIGKKRMGQQKRQNQMLGMSDSDIFVLMEADTCPIGNRAIEELITPILRNKKLGVVVGRAIAILPQTFFEKILCFGDKLKEDLFLKWKNGNTVYSYRGQAMRALSREFAKLFKWPDDAPEDAYMYFRMRELGFQYAVRKSAKSYMSNPKNIKDRLAQCRKFQSGRKALLKHFQDEIIADEYNISTTMLLQHIAKWFMKNPFWTTLYLIEATANRIVTQRVATFSPFHVISYSSKNLGGFVTNS